MFLKRLVDCPGIVANDGCRLKELFHPDRDAIGDVDYSLAVAWVDPGERTLPHRLARQSEAYLILRGEGRMHVGEEDANVAPGDAVVVPADTVQWIENTGNEVLHFAVVVRPPWQANDDRRV